MTRLECAAAAALLCCAAPRAPTAEAPGATPQSGRCTDAFGPSPFSQPDATHILVANFYGVNSTDPLFADSVTRQVDDELRRFREEKLPSMPVHVPADEVEFRRLTCFVDSHEQAEQVAAAWDADLVIWGRAYCNLTPEVHQTIAIRQEVTTGSVDARDQSSVKVGQVHVESAKPYTVCPKATLVRSDARLRLSNDGLDLGSLAHLDLPTLESTKPFQLIEFTLGLHFLERNQPWIAARFFERSAEHVLSPRDENLSTLQVYLGFAYLELPGGSATSIAYSRSALSALSGSGSVLEASAVGNIGMALVDQGKYAEALEYCQRALNVANAAVGGWHPDVAVFVSNIGLVLTHQGKYADALEHYRRALAIEEKALGADHPSVATVLSNIGLVLTHQRKYADALEHYRRALTIEEKALGAQHPNVAIRLNNIGGALVEQGEYADALEYFLRAGAILEKSLGAVHPKVAASLSNIGATLREQGKYAEALEFYRRALAIDEKLLGAEHPNVAIRLNNIGSALYSQEKYAEAADYHRRALHIAASVLGIDSPMSKEFSSNLSACEQQLRESESAVERP
jgi:tetratricopeptide (TPR) repeat protein